jgi:hypothetical protein
LVAGDVFETASGKAVEGERRNARGIEDIDPIVDILRDAAGSMQQHDRRQTLVDGVRNAQFTGNGGDWTTARTGEELLIG